MVRGVVRERVDKAGYDQRDLAGFSRCTVAAVMSDLHNTILLLTAH